MSADNTLSRAFSLAVHELRTPITVAAGYLRMLLREQAGPLEERQRKMIEEAERSCARINTLVSEMSEFGRLERGDIALPRTTFDLAALVAEVASSMHEGGDRGVRLDVRASRAASVAGDRARVAAAIEALLHASLRERAGPAVVVVECSVYPRDERDWVIVSIGDDAVVPALAEGADEAPEFDEWRGGTGLALPVARRVIEAHGGRLWSAPGDNPRAGAALRLPLAP